MRGRLSAITKATALEIVSEPLFFLLTLSAVCVLTFTSYLHIHQFGEASRMARDIGLSSILIFGIVYAVFSSIRTMRREIESGTLQMALVSPISREAFFLYKAAGVMLSLLVFFLTVFSAAIITAVGSEAVPLVAELHASSAEASDCCQGSLPGTIWSVSMAFDVAVILLPFLVAAFLNRFFAFRFALSAAMVALIVAILGVFTNLAVASSLFGLKAQALTDLALRMIPTGLILLSPIFAFAAFALALSVKLKDNAVALGSLVIFAASLPLFGNYYLSHALTKGGAIPYMYVLYAFLAALPFIAAFLTLGAIFMKDRDVG